jgi:hypothetical protein
MKNINYDIKEPFEYNIKSLSCYNKNIAVSPYFSLQHRIKIAVHNSIINSIWSPVRAVSKIVVKNKL